MKIICFGNSPLILDTWAAIMWIHFMFINTKIKLNVYISYFQKADKFLNEFTSYILESHFLK